MERKNLWAPWRINYIQGLDKPGDCFICRNRDNPRDDDKNLVLWRSGNSIVILNRYPYNNGHILVMPKRHVGAMDRLNDRELFELFDVVRLACRALDRVMQPHGYNIGINLGDVAGAGVPDHLHVHIVPRWNGDTNFMPVLGDVKVIPEHVLETRDKLAQAMSALAPKKRTGKSKGQGPRKK